MSKAKPATVAYLSHRCRNCHRVRYTAPGDWYRAARPHCLHCGGPLEDTAASEERTLGTKEERAQLAESRKQSKERSKELLQLKCWSCGRAFMNGELLAGHLMNSTECVFDYRADGQVIDSCCKGTATLVKRSSSYRIMALQVVPPAWKVDWVEVTRYRDLAEATRCMNRLNGRPL